MKQEREKSDMVLHVQEVHLSWGKQSRGGPGAQVRNRLPEVYRIEKDFEKLNQYDKIQGLVLSQHFPDYDIHIFVTESDDRIALNETLHIKARLLEATRHKDNELEVIWSGRRSRRRRQIALLQPGQWVQLQYSTWSNHRTCFMRNTYNIYWGNSALLDIDLYLNNPPVTSFQRGFYHSRF